MTKKERYIRFIDYFSLHQPNAQTELNYNNPFELLVAVILSAQCTDKRVNLVTPNLFNKFPTPSSLAQADLADVFDCIKSISYPNNKAKHLIGMAQILVTEFKEIIPSDVSLLQKMPGVGRKTANVIASIIYEAPTMAVDTHVFRVSKRLGLSNGKTPLAVENDLTKNIPNDKIRIAHHWLILHGRYICTARNPQCGKCPIQGMCIFFGNRKGDIKLF